MHQKLIALSSAAEGLLWRSETDAPLLPFEIQSSEAGLPDSLRALCNADGAISVEIQELPFFFRAHLKAYDGADAAETERIARFNELFHLLQELPEIKVYRIGTIHIEAFITGKLEEGVYGGLRTTQVET